MAKTYVPHPEKRAATAKASYERHREERRAAARAYYEANREERKRSAKAYREANPEKVRASRKAWRLANAEKERARGRTRYRSDERRRTRTKAWVRRNPAALAEYKARRRALKLNAPGRGVTAAEWRNLLVESLGICAYCNERRQMAMDHIEPLSKSGAHDTENIAAACKSCNSSKGDTSLLVWLARQ